MTYELIHGPFAEPTTRKGQIARGAINHRDLALDRARLNLNAAIERANFVFQNKLRMAYGVPYHEWQDALSRGQLYVDHLLTVYEPSYVPPQPAFVGARLRIGRCPPWATRRYWQAAQAQDATAAALIRQPVPMQTGEIGRRLHVVQAIIAHPRGSAERTAEFVVQLERLGRGFSVRTLNRWVSDHEAAGCSANSLARKVPSDVGKRRQNARGAACATRHAEHAR